MEYIEQQELIENKSDDSFRHKYDNMFQRNDIIILKINKDGLFFSPQDFLPEQNIALQLATNIDIEYFEERFHGLRVEVLDFDSGILKCKILEYNAYDKYVFNNQTYDISIIEKLLLSSGDTGKILNFAKRKTPKPEVTLKARPEVIKESRVEKPVVKQEYRKAATKYITLEKNITFEFPFNKLQIIDSYAIIRENFYFNDLHKAIDLEIKIENGFIKKGFDSIKKPFSFLFFLENGDNQFFIWETLFGTDGTYLWFFKKNPGEKSEYKNALKDDLEETKEEISKIKSWGRIKYLKNTPENFRRIFHDYSEKDGFENWKKAINELVMRSVSL